MIEPLLEVYGGHVRATLERGNVYIKLLTAGPTACSGATV